MYLTFLDGSGNTGTHLNHPTISAYFLLALAVPAEKARGLEDHATRVLEARFGAPCRAPGFECKGSDMYRGEGPCAAMPPADRIALYGELTRLLPRYGVTMVWQGIDKARLAARYRNPMHPHKLAFIYLVEQVERFLRAERRFGLLISDEEKEVEEQVVEDLQRYKEMGTSFGHKPLDLKCIVDNVHWVKSHNSRLLQLADICAYLCQRYQRDREKTSRTAVAVQQLWTGLQPRVWSGRIWP